MLETAVPREFPYTQNVFDSLTDTHGKDAPQPLSLLVNNWKVSVNPRRLKKIAVDWAWENHRHQRQYRGLTSDEILNRQLPLVQQVEAKFKKLLKIDTKTLVQVKGSRQFITSLNRSGFFPKKYLQDDGLYLSSEKILEFLRQHPPMALLKGSRYQTIDQALTQHSPELLLSLARNVDDKQWHTDQQQIIASAKPDELTRHPIIVEVVSRDEFPSLQHNADKIARDDRAVGLVFFVTPSQEFTQRPAALSFFASRILHYIYELHSFGTVFPEIFKALEVPTIDKTATHLQALFWRGMRRREDVDSFFFGTHSLLEAIYWQKTRDQMGLIIGNSSSLLNPAYSNSDKLVQTKNGQGAVEVIGLHPISVIAQIFDGKARENTTTKRQVRLNLLMKLLNISDLADVEKLLLTHLSDGHIKL